MNSVAVGLCFLFFVCSARGLPASDVEAAPETRRAAKEEVVRTEVNLKEERIESALERGTWRPTVRCAEIVPEEGEPGEENHEACEAHCKTFREEYARGRCFRGVCRCEESRRNGEARRESDGHPTVRCEHIHPEEGNAGRNNHRACRAHCRSLDSIFRQGQCREGVCHCRRETLVKVSTTPRTNACDDHAECESRCGRGAEEGEGRCIEGRCRCGRMQRSETTA